MNYDLAMMALDGLARAPLTIETLPNGTIVIKGIAASFKELARLCLLMGGEASGEDSFELQPGRHVSVGAPAVTLRLM